MTGRPAHFYCCSFTLDLRIETQMAVFAAVSENVALFFVTTFWESWAVLLGKGEVIRRPRLSGLCMRSQTSRNSHEWFRSHENSFTNYQIFTASYSNSFACPRRELVCWSEVLTYIWVSVHMLRLYLFVKLNVIFWMSGILTVEVNMLETFLLQQFYFNLSSNTFTFGELLCQSCL